MSTRPWLALITRIPADPVPGFVAPASDILGPHAAVETAAPKSSLAYRIMREQYTWDQQVQMSIVGVTVGVRLPFGNGVRLHLGNWAQSPFEKWDQTAFRYWCLIPNGT